MRAGLLPLRRNKTQPNNKNKNKRSPGNNVVHDRSSRINEWLKPHHSGAMLRVFAFLTFLRFCHVPDTFLCDIF